MKINGVDYHYYESISEIFSPQYDWEHFVLTAGAAEKDLDFDFPISQRKPDQIKAIQLFIHEYIHYLQNFSTTWGAGIFSDLFLAYSKISVSKATGLERFTPPLDSVKINNTLFDDGVDMRNHVLRKLVTGDDYEHELKNEVQKISYFYTSESVGFSNGICKYTVGVKGIREHMANIGSFLFLNYSDDDIQNDNTNCSQFIDADLRMYKSPEYWIMFEYVKGSYPNLKNIGVGLFFLCNECLTRLNPEKALFRFFQKFQSYSDRHLPNKNFKDFVDAWLANEPELTSYNRSFSLTLEHVAKQLAYINSNLQHDLPVAAKKIIEMMILNVKNTGGGRGLFSANFNFKELQSWKELIHKFGTSMVSFNQDIKVLGSESHCENMLDAFKTLNSATLAFKEANNCSIHFTCPFLIDIPICKSSLKDSKICDGNPYEMLTTQSHDACCNLIAGIYLLGLEERIIVNLEE